MTKDENQDFCNYMIQNNYKNTIIQEDKNTDIPQDLNIGETGS